MKTAKTAKIYKLGGCCFTDSRDMSSKYTDDKYTRFYSVFIRTFSPREEVEAFLRSVDFDEYAFILHDSDVKEDGSLKEPHFHILVYRKTGFRLTPAARAFTQNTLIQPCRSRKLAFEYLTHKNDPDKHSYSSSLICQFHRDGKDTFSLTHEEAQRNSFAQMLDDISQLSRRELAVKYGRDYMLNYRRYEQFASDVAYEDMSLETDNLSAELNNISSLSDDVVIVSEQDGDSIRMSASNWFACQISDKLEQQGMLPDSREIVTWYHELLTQYRKYLKDVALFQTTGIRRGE